MSMTLRFLFVALLIRLIILSQLLVMATQRLARLLLRVVEKRVAQKKAKKADWQEQFRAIQQKQRVLIEDMRKAGESPNGSRADYAITYSDRLTDLETEYAHLRASVATLRTADVRFGMAIVRTIRDTSGWFADRWLTLVPILQNWTTPSFYADLLIWTFIPSRYAESLMGDLLEQVAAPQCRHNLFGIRLGMQAIKCVTAYLWDRIEKYAALAVLIDIIRRWIGRG